MNRGDEMTFLCPFWSIQEASLQILSKIELPPDIRSDEIALQIIGCSRCEFEGIAVYEESRRGSLEHDSFTHNGYRVNSQSLRILKEKIELCPEPARADCQCETHQELGRQKPSGRWDGLNGIFLEDSFAINT
jgi:hypothetical protein